MISEHALIDWILSSNTLISQTNILDESLTEIVFRHIYDITATAKKFTGFRGLGEIFTVLGVFTFALIAGILSKSTRMNWSNYIEKYYWIFFGCILLHVLLSGDVARMFYFGAPLYALMIVYVFKDVIAFLSKKEG